MNRDVCVDAAKMRSRKHVSKATSVITSGESWLNACSVLSQD